MQILRRIRYFCDGFWALSLLNCSCPIKGVASMTHSEQCWLTPSSSSCNGLDCNSIGHSSAIALLDLVQLCPQISQMIKICLKLVKELNCVKRFIFK